MKKLSLGFTLIELMVVIGILSILVFLAYPSYSTYLQRARAENARVGMVDITRFMEQHYAKNRTFCAAAGQNCGAPNINNVANSDYYNFGLLNVTPGAYRLTAVPKTGVYSDATLAATPVYLIYDSISQGFARCNKGGYESSMKEEKKQDNDAQGCEIA